MPVVYFKNTHLNSPMRKALQKKEGTIRGIDFDKKELFAAYTYIEELNWGLVSKIHVSEINQPYLTGIYITLFLAIIFISLGTFLFIKITNPMLNQIIDSEEKYRTLVERMNEGLMQVTNDDTIQYVNQSICNIFGYTKEELIGKKGVDIFIFHEDKHLIIKKNKSRLDKISDRYEVRGVKKNGEIIWLLISGTPLSNSHGEVVGSIGIISDITKQKNAEEELKIEKTYLEELFENAPEAIVTLDNDDRILKINKEFTNIFEYTAEEAIGKYINDLIVPEDLKEEAFKATTDVSIGKRINFETIRKTKCGKLINVSILGNPIVQDGKQLAVFGIYRDISESKKNEEAIIKNSKRLESLVSILQRETQNVQEFLDNALNEIIELTESKIGYIYFYDDEKQEFILNSWSKEVMKECSIINPQTVYCLDKTGIWGEAVRQAKPIIINDFDADNPLKKGYPEGHVHLKSFLTVPIFHNKKIVAVVGVGNKESDYDHSDVLQLTLYMDSVWKTIENIKYDEYILQEKKFSDMLIESLPGIFFMFDSNFKPKRWNRNSALFLGLTDEEMKTHNTLDYIADADKEKLINSFKNTFSFGYAQDIIRIRRYDRVEFSYHLTAKLLETKDGPMLIGVGIDITERVKAEEELKQRQAFIQTILDNLPIGVALNSINDGTATYINKKFEEVYGWPKDELLDIENFFYKVYPDESYRNELMTRVMNDINSMDASRMKWENIVATGKDGCKRVINCQNIPLLEQNTMVSTVVDITKQKRAEEELQKFTKMESLGVIAGGIAHNFKNILANISFNVSLAKYKPETITKNIEKIEQAINQASALASRFQTFSTGGEPIINVISIKDVLDGVIKIAESGSHNLIDINYSSDLHNVKADPHQLNEVFMNLIINAHQAMPIGGKITINAENLYLNTVNDLNLNKGDYVKITLRDQGIGIPKELLSKIFDPFFTTKSEGQGLGLSSVHYIIHKHKGAITVDSEQGKWTQFDIYLPASDVTLITKEQNMETLKSGACKKILYMDDNESLRENIIEIGELLDYEIDAVADGYNAIKYYQDAYSAGNTYSAVILDLTIQGSDMQGDDVLTELLKIDANVKAIVFSGHSTKPIVANYKDYGFKGRLDKPVTIDNLANVLREVCG
jgi:PAS domain S-box-containing protein